MASTVEARRLTETHRLAQARMGVETVRGMTARWGLLDARDLTGTTSRWLSGVVPYVQAQRMRSAVLAASYLRAYRMLELGDLEGFELEMAGPADLDMLATSLTVTGPVRLRSQMHRGLRDAALAANLASARAAMRHVGDGGRDTVLGTVRADSRAAGWARVTSGAPCAFCAMLASRGPVYKTRETAAFQAHPDAVHDNDACTFEPVYIADAQWPPLSRMFRDLWDESTAGLGGAEARRAFAAALEARNN